MVFAQTDRQTDRQARPHITSASLSKQNKESTSSSRLLYKLAFTLAEVLIVLGIIGIIAELTIPTVLSNTKKQETVARVKKAYSTLAQATSLISIDCSGDLMNCITSATSSADNDPTSRAQLVALYKDKLRIAKDCTDGVTTGCFPDETYLFLKNTAFAKIETVDWAKDSKMVLNDGTSLVFDWNPNINSPFAISVDINGIKKPNQMGKDLFLFLYIKDKRIIRPDPTNDCTTSGNGYGCASKVILEGEITYY